MENVCNPKLICQIDITLRRTVYRIVNGVRQNPYLFKPSMSTVTTGFGEEIDELLKATVSLDLDLDFLNWWYYHKCRFLTLYEKASDLLCTHSSNIAVASSFSYARKLVSDVHNCLLDCTVRVRMHLRALELSFQKFNL